MAKIESVIGPAIISTKVARFLNSEGNELMKSEKSHRTSGYSKHYLDRRSFLREIGEVACFCACSLGLPLNAASMMNEVRSVLSSKLRKKHPRLHLTAEGWSELRIRVKQDEMLEHWLAALVQNADTMLNEPPVAYKLDGPRLLNVSRTALDRISTLAALYRLEGDMRFADRAREELRAICSFPSWHPSHFLDVAEMTNAAGLGYDWLYDVLPEGERQNLRLAILNFGLKPGIEEYGKDLSWTRPGANNWGQVCAGGLTVGALAVASEMGNRPEPATILSLTTDKVRYAMASYVPDGGWPEGPMYWNYGTTYTCYMLSALISVLGTDFGLSEMPGFAKTGDFRIATIGPTSLFFNYSDCHSKADSASAMFWLAKCFGRPLYATAETQFANQLGPNIFDLIWYSRFTEKGVVTPTLDFHFLNIDVACFRSSWTDPGAFYVGFKGGNNAAPHAHLDLGSFVLDALGERWALDLGTDNYNLPGYFGKLRWTYYRLRTEGHNTLTLGTENQNLKATATLSQFESTDRFGSAIVDLTEAYSPVFTKATRKLTLERLPTQRILVEDSLNATRECVIRWNMHTSANIQLHDREATLERRGKHLRVKIEKPEGVRFEVIGCNPPPPQAQQPNVHNLIIFVPLKIGSNDILVSFTQP